LLKGGDKRHGNEEESQVGEEDDQEDHQEVTTSVGRVAKRKRPTVFKGCKATVTTFRFGPWLQSQATEHKESVPATADAFFFLSAFFKRFLVRPYWPG
jgi:hypothetical protein